MNKKRARAFGICPGIYNPGPNNDITDVAGVAVGHYTLIEGDDVRTGATAVLPHGGNLFQERVPAGPVAELPNELVSPLFQAAIEATEETIYNALFMAATVTGYQGRTVHALPVERVVELIVG